MIFDLTNKRIIITGASSGVGAHFARLLADQGANLGLLARRLDKLDVTKHELESTSDITVAVAECDMLDPAAIDRAITDLHSALGGIDILINNAGITRQATALEQTLDDWDTVVNTNLRAAWLASTITARLMKTDDIKGSIINIASILGLRVANQVAPYAISKAGMIQMTKALALEWARFGIRVNALAPGYLYTDMNARFFTSEAGKKILSRVPQRRLGKMSELDGPLLLLASDAGSFMSGTIIPVDGGHLINTL